MGLILDELSIFHIGFVVEMVPKYERTINYPF